MNQDPNALKDFNFSLYDLQVELAKTDDVIAVAVPHGGTVHDSGKVIKDGAELFADRTQGRCEGFVTAVALFRVVKAKNTGFTDEQVFAAIKDFVAPRQPGQHLNPYVLEAVTKRAALLAEVAA